MCIVSYNGLVKMERHLSYEIKTTLRRCIYYIINSSQTSNKNIHSFKHILFIRIATLRVIGHKNRSFYLCISMSFFKSAGIRAFGQRQILGVQKTMRSKYRSSQAFIKINLSYQRKEVASCNFCTGMPRNCASLQQNFTEIQMLSDFAEIFKVEPSNTPLRPHTSFY